MVSWHTLPLLAPLLLLVGCTSLSAPRQDSAQWKAEWRDRASRWADGAGAGASAVGSSIGTAARGVANGFDPPEEGEFGAYPKGYPVAVRKHLIRFEGVPGDSSFRFGRPEKGYMNHGILRGGGVAWQGYLVDVEVELPGKGSGPARARRYVVRLRDGEVIEVHDAQHTAALRRNDSAPASIPAE